MGVTYFRVEDTVLITGSGPNCHFRVFLPKRDIQ